MEDNDEPERFVVVQLEYRDGFLIWRGTGILSMGEYVMFETLHRNKAQFPVCAYHCEGDECKCVLDKIAFHKLWDSVKAWTKNPEYATALMAVYGGQTLPLLYGRSTPWTTTLLKCWHRSKKPKTSVYCEKQNMDE